MQVVFQIPVLNLKCCSRSFRLIFNGYKDNWLSIQKKKRLKIKNLSTKPCTSDTGEAIVFILDLST